MMLSILIPALNEAGSVKELLHEIRRDVTFTKPVQVIFINDGSTDQTTSVLDQLAATDPLVKVIHLQRNYGKAIALQAGIDYVQEGLVATLDADLQDVPAELQALNVKLKQGFDLVVGWKKDRHDPLSKKIPSRIANGITRFFTKVDIHDMNSGIKLMRLEVAKSLRLYGDLHRFIPALSAANGFQVGEVAVRHRKRKFGVTKYGAKRILRSMFDFLTLQLITRFKSRPLHFFGPLGLISFLLGLIINGYLSILWFMGESIGTRPLLLFGALLIIFGIQMLSIGLLGELVVAESTKFRYTERKSP